MQLASGGHDFSWDPNDQNSLEGMMINEAYPPYLQPNWLDHSN